jgi:hypothetical protein
LEDQRVSEEGREKNKAAANIGTIGIKHSCHKHQTTHKSLARSLAYINLPPSDFHTLVSFFFLVLLLK